MERAPFGVATLGALTGWRRLAAAAATGAVMGLAQPPFGLWPLFFIAAPSLFFLWRGAARWPAAFGVGWAGGSGFFAVVLHWIFEPFLIDPDRHLWMAPFVALALWCGLALLWGAAFAVARLAMGPRAGLTGALALAAAMGLAEAVRGGLFTGFPWALPAYIWADAPVAQALAYAGPYGLSLATLTCGFALFAPSTVRARAVTGGVVLSTVFALWLWGGWREGAAPGPAPDAPVIRIVQPNIPQARKWDSAFARENFETALRLSQGGADLVIWPEVAVPFLLEESPAARVEIAAAAGAPVLVGSLTRAPSGPRFRNSGVGVGADATVTGRYDKRHLVPLGEYVPMAGLLGALGFETISERAAGLESGGAQPPLELPGAPPVAVLICYEGVFPREVSAAAQNAKWIALITNDAWFGAWAGPLQHFAQARLRAIETGLPVFRAANTGVSGVIDAHGRVLERAPLDVAATMLAALPDTAASRFYFRYGSFTDSFLALVAFLWLGFKTLRNLRRRGNFVARNGPRG